MKDGRIELYGKDNMQNIISEIKNILLEKKFPTQAQEELDDIASEIEKTVKDDSLKAQKKSKKKKNRSDVEEDEDIVTKSKKDLEGEKGEDSKGEDREDQKVKTPDESPSTINLADAGNFEKLIDVLNQFRAAHSFTNEDVYNRLKDFYEALERQEKEVLFILIKALVQITVLDVSGKDAYTPSKLMFNIKKTGSDSSEKKKSMERRIDSKYEKSSEEKKEKQKSSSGLPITTIGAGVNESFNNKKELIKIVKRNNS